MRRWAPTVVTFLVSFAVLGPLYVGRGLALRGDMVFAPDQPWKRAWLGLDGSVPRAVPMDALVSLADEVVPGALLQRLLLTAAFAAGGLGIARLSARCHWLGQVAAVVVYLWNPWVEERLAIGQWPTVLGYGLLPWVVGAAARAREGGSGGWAATALLLVLSGVCAPSTGLVAAAVALAVIVPGRRPRQLLAVVGIGAVANLPWMVPAALGPGVHASGTQFGAFAARGESTLGTLVSLLSMGGIWKSSIVPPERTHAVVVGTAAVLALALLAAFRYAVPTMGRRTAAGVASVATAAFVLALLPSIGPVGRALGDLSEHWAALGILRDSHRYLAPLGLVLAMGAAGLVDRLFSRDRPGDPGRRAVGLLLVVAPVALLPSLVWGLAGGLRPVVYPHEWQEVAARVAGSEGATVVLPWTGSYRGFGWNDHRAVLDPAPRMVAGDVLIDDRVYLRHQVLPGEDPFLARVRSALDEGPQLAPAALRALGVRWVLVEKDNGVEAGDVPLGRVVADGRGLRLVDLGAPSGDLRRLRPGPPAAAVVLGDLLTAFAACVSVLQLARQSVRTRK